MLSKVLLDFDNRFYRWSSRFFVFFVILINITIPSSLFAQQLSLIDTITNADGTSITFSYEAPESGSFKVGDTANLWIEVIPNELSFFTGDAFVMLASANSDMLEMQAPSADVKVPETINNLVWYSYGEYKSIPQIISAIQWLDTACLIANPDIISFVLQATTSIAGFLLHLDETGYEEGAPSEELRNNSILRAGVDIGSCQVFGYRYKVPIKLMQEGSVSLKAHTTYKRWNHAYGGASVEWSFDVQGTVPPTVLSHSYSEDPGSNIYVTFSKDMNESTMSNIIVKNDSLCCTCNFSFDHSTHVLTIDPSFDFAEGETITVTIEAGVEGVKDLIGQGLASPYTFFFRCGNLATIDTLSVSPSPVAGSPITVTAWVTVDGLEAELVFELLDSGGNHIRYLGNPVTLASQNDPQLIEVTFTNHFGVDGVVEATLSDSSGPRNTKSQSITIDSKYNGYPFIVGINVIGREIDGITDRIYPSHPIASTFAAWNETTTVTIGDGQLWSPYLYDGGPITIQLLTWEDGGVSNTRCWLKYALTVNKPADWEWVEEVALTYDGTVEHVISENGGDSYTLTVAKHSFTILESEFGPFADGVKTLWIKPTKLTGYGSSLRPNSAWNFNLQDHPIRDDDTKPPEVFFEGQDGYGNLCAMELMPRRLDFAVTVVDNMGISQEGLLTDVDSGMISTEFGYAITDNEPSTLSDDVFNFYHTQPYVQGVHHSGHQELSQDRETKWLTYRVVATGADNDWTVEGYEDRQVVRRDWTGQIPDDDAESPEVTDITHPSYAECSDPVSVSAKITDETGIKINENGKHEVQIHWSYNKYGSFNSAYYLSIENIDIYNFDIPAPGWEHVGDTLYFYIEATDADNDRTGDEATTKEDNSGQHYTLQVMDSVPPTIQNINISDGAVLSGNAIISADTADNSGYTDVTVKINESVVSHSLPFIWNTLIPSWSNSITVATDTDGWGNMPLITAGEGRELWAGYLEGGSIYVRHSPDGTTWGTPVLAAPPRDTIMRPAMLRDSTGTLWLAYQDYDQNLNMSLYITYSADQGQTWSTPVQATSGIDVVGFSLIQDNSGTFRYVFYSYDESWNNVIRVINSTNGTDWNLPITIDPNSTWDLDYIMPIIAQAPDGKLHVFYQYYDNNDSRYYLVRSTSSGGISWSGREIVSFNMEASYMEPGKIIRHVTGLYWFSYISDDFSYLSPSNDLVTCGDPVTVADVAMAFDVAQSGDGTFWIASLLNGEIQVFHNTVESLYAIIIEVKDKGGNTTIQEINNVTIAQEPVNHSPVANGQDVITEENASLDIVLTATDADEDSLTYEVVTQPSHGTLSGTAPNLTYIPYTNYTGPDNLTFRANDGSSDSNTATVSIQVFDVLIPGDLDDSGAVNLSDAILALQVCTGITPSSTIQKEADVNGDDSIGLEEVIYILQDVSGLR